MARRSSPRRLIGAAVGFLIVIVGIVWMVAFLIVDGNENRAQTIDLVMGLVMIVAALGLVIWSLRRR